MRVSRAEPRAQERKRRVSDSVVDRTPTTTWLRAQQVDRVAIEGCADVPRGLALPLAIPHGGARLDRWSLGGKSGRAPAPFLSNHGRGVEGTRCAAKEL